MKWVCIELFLVQSQLDRLFLLQGHLAVLGDDEGDTCLALRPHGLLNLPIPLGVVDDADGPGALPIDLTRGRAQFVVKFRVQHCCGTLCLHQHSQVVVDEDLDVILGNFEVVSLEIDESMAHLSVVRTTTCLQLELHVVHHDDFLA